MRSHMVTLGRHGNTELGRPPRTQTQACSPAPPLWQAPAKCRTVGTTAQPQWRSGSPQVTGRVSRVPTCPRTGCGAPEGWRPIRGLDSCPWARAGQSEMTRDSEARQRQSQARVPSTTLPAHLCTRVRTGCKYRIPCGDRGQTHRRGRDRQPLPPPDGC